MYCNSNYRNFRVINNWFRYLSVQIGADVIIKKYFHLTRKTRTYIHIQDISMNLSTSVILPIHYIMYPTLNRNILIC